MGVTQVGFFKLVDPPEGQVSVIRDTLALIDYPWHRLLPVLWKDPDQAVIVRWDPRMEQGSTGKFLVSTYEIVLSTRYSNWQHGVPFVFAHEVGHLVDRATLSSAEHDDLIALYHGDERTHRLDGVSQNGMEHPWSHEQPHATDNWRNGHNPYLFRYYEAFADSFVEAFAPALFFNRGIRFVHSTGDLEAVCDIVLRRDIMPFTDVPEDHPHRDAIEWAAGEGLVKGKEDGTFDPQAPVTRGQLATILYRLVEERADES